MLLHPSYGLSRLFYFGLVDLAEGMLLDLDVAIWNPEDTTDLGQWLVSHQVSGLLTSDRPAPYVATLDKLGVWVQDMPDGDPRERINRWLHQRRNASCEDSGFSLQPG